MTAATIESEIQELMTEVFDSLIKVDKGYEFLYAMQKRAELTTRAYASTPVENRDVAMGQISICYELADGMKSALDAAISEAKEKEANRIRKEAPATQ